MNDTIVVRNLSDLILIVGTVDTDIVTKVFAYLVIPSKIEFHTGVFHSTAINIRSHHEPVFSIFNVEIEINTQATVEESGIKTDIGLL